LFLPIRFGKLFRCGKLTSPPVVETITTNNDEQQHLKEKLNEEESI
jgi:hypothetical protein